MMYKNFWAQNPTSFNLGPPTTQPLGEPKLFKILKVVPIVESLKKKKRKCMRKKISPPQYSHDSLFVTFSSFSFSFFPSSSVFSLHPSPTHICTHYHNTYTAFEIRAFPHINIYFSKARFLLKDCLDFNWMAVVFFT